MVKVLQHSPLLQTHSKVWNSLLEQGSTAIEDDSSEGSTAPSMHLRLQQSNYKTHTPHLQEAKPPPSRDNFVSIGLTKYVRNLQMDNPRLNLV